MNKKILGTIFLLFYLNVSHPGVGYSFDCNYDSWGTSSLDPVTAWPSRNRDAYKAGLKLELIKSMKASPFSGVFTNGCFQIPSAEDPIVWHLYPLVDVREARIKEYLQQGGVSQKVIEDFVNKKPLASTHPDYLKAVRLLNAVEMAGPRKYEKIRSRSFKNSDNEVMQGEILYDAVSCPGLKGFKPSWGGEFCYKIWGVDAGSGLKDIYEYYGI